MASLTKLGELRHEDQLASGKRPDIWFSGSGISFIADVTAASDTGIDERNPYQEFAEIIEEEKGRVLGLKPGGVRLNVYEEDETVGRGRRRRLRLPPFSQLRSYVQQVVIPELIGQLAGRRWPLSMEVDDERAGFSLTIADGPYSGGGYGAYDVPTIANHNPLYSALSKKARKLRGADAVCGIFVGDADCRSIKTYDSGFGSVTTKAIVDAFFEEYPHISFVMLLSVSQSPRSFADFQPPKPRHRHQIFCRRHTPQQVHDILKGVSDAIPNPICTPENARYRAQERGFGHGYGTIQWSGKHMRMSVRKLMEVLAGTKSVAEFNSNYDFAPPGQFDGSKMINPFERALAEGRLVTRLEVEIGTDDDDDNIVFVEFGERDASISKFH